MDKAERNLSWAEVLVVDIFCSLFGQDKRNYLIRHHNVPFKDTEGRTRLHDFVILTQAKRIAIEIEGESYHNPLLVGEEKFSDDLLRGNAQILQGWLRLSYTPRNLSDNVEIVKKQLRELLGDSPIFSDYEYDATEDEISHAKASYEHELTEIEKATTQVIDRLLITHHLFREKTRNLFTQSSPTPQDLLDYIIGRGMIQILHEYEDRGHTASVQHIEPFTRMHDQESTRDALRLIQVLPLLSPENDHESYNALKSALTGWADECQHNPLRLRLFAKSIHTLHTGVYFRFQITPSGDIDKEFFLQEEFQEQLWLLWLGYTVLSMLFQYLSLKLGRSRTAIIGVTEGGGEFCYTILDKDQYDKANVTYVPSPFYEKHFPAIVYLMSLNGSKVRKLLMDDNKFVSRKVTFNLPAPQARSYYGLQ